MTKLPAGWHWVKLRDVCQQDRQTIEPFSQLSTQLPYLSLEHIESNTGRILQIPESNNVQSNTFAFDNRHVLYGKLRPYLNKVALPDFAGKCTTELIPLLPSPEVDRVFLAWSLRRKETVDAVMRETTGSRMPRAEMETLLALEIPLPPLDEQRRIVAILNEKMAAIERARAAAEAQLKAAKALPSAYLREVFESREAAGWERKRLGEIVVSVQNGIYKSNEFYGKGEPFLRMYNIPNESIYLNFDELARVTVTDGEKEKFALQIGDILVSRVNSFELVGKCAWVGSEAVSYMYENMLIRLRFDDSVDSLFIAQQLQTKEIRNQVEKVAKVAIGQSSINSTDIRSFELCIPSLSKQKQIAQRLSNQIKVVEPIKKTLKSQLTAINALPAALLRQAFNGEL